MNFEDMISKFTPGMVVRRKTWDSNYTLQMIEGDVVRLRDSRCPSFGPEWRKGGYDGNAEDYEVVSVKHSAATDGEATPAAGVLSGSGKATPKARELDPEVEAVIAA